MKNAIEKLIKEYEIKIDNEEKKLSAIKKENSTARRNGDEKTMFIMTEERQIADARRQAYVQAKADINSLFDYL